MSRLAYDGLGVLASLMAAPALPVLALTRYGAGLGERLGRLSPAVRALAGRRPIWIHAASVGEVLAVTPLIELLHSQRGETPILLSTTSLTGRETARAQSGVAAVMLLPLDLRWIVTRVLRALTPSALVIVETEIWPALLQAAAAAEVPVVVVSGRMSARAAGRYAWVRPVLRDTFRCVSGFGMQTQADADRVIALGAPPERVRVTGNLKYARLVPRTARAAQAVLPGVDGRPVLIAASTQPGEEQVVLAACAGVWQAHPECLLVLAPRRPERFDEVHQLLAQAGVRCERRSRLGERVLAETQVLLLDSLGELPGLLGSARAVFVGGTIAPLGGHNVLEPAAVATPVCFGPHTANVAEAASALIAGGGGVVVHDAAELGAVWQHVLAEPEAGKAMGARALAVVRARAAVVTDTFAVVEWVLR